LIISQYNNNHLSLLSIYLMAMISILNYMTLYNYISLISLMIGIYLHIRGYSVLKYLLPFIFYTLIIEVFLNYYLSKTYGTSEKMYSYFNV